MVASPSFETTFQIEEGFAVSTAGHARYLVLIEQVRVEIHAFWVANGQPAGVSADNLSVHPIFPPVDGMVTVCIVFTLP